MRKFWIAAVFTLLVAASAVADQINFNFTTGAPSSVIATSAAGFVSGPSMLQNISDTTTGVVVAQSGKYVNGNTGPAINLAQFANLVIGAFTGAGANSVLVEDSSNNVLVAGVMQDGGSLLSTVPNGTGSFLATFNVTYVNPAALALFGLGPGFSPDGSVALTFGNAKFDGTTFTAAIGGGSVTIQTVPEPASLGLIGMGLLTVGRALRLRKRTNGTPR